MKRYAGILMIALSASAVEACLVFAQNASQLAFEAVSIKPNVSGSHNSGTSTRQGRLSATNVTVQQLITQAYRMQDFQVIGGPDWIETEHFDIQAKAEDGEIPDTPSRPDDPAPRPLELMMQAMLADRFQLSLNHETRELPVYTLTVAKDGPKIKPVPAGENETQLPNATGRGAAGAPSGAVGAGSMSTNVNGAKGEMNANTVPLSRLVTALSRQLRRPVIDKTDLQGMYTIHLEWAPDANSLTGGLNAAPPDSIAAPAGPSLFTALQEQLGLRLTSAKGPVEVVVVRSVQRPSEN